ncbi:MAG: hypothetical protein R2824_27015 [Saprospiraceae bacterium]
MSPLYTKLQEIGGVLACLSGSKLKNILQLSCCILKTRSCNLQKCRDELSSVTGEQDLKQDTAYARLKRVFQTGLIDPALKAIFLFILYLLHPREQALLVVDRTDFQIGGRFWANLLVFGLVWKVFSFPWYGAIWASVVIPHTGSNPVTGSLVGLVESFRFGTATVLPNR